MSKSPQTQHPPRRGRLSESAMSWLRRNGDDHEEQHAPVPMVAEALSEEEAMAELEARRREEEEKVTARQRAEAEKQRAEAERLAAKEAKRLEAERAKAQKLELKKARAEARRVEAEARLAEAARHSAEEPRGPMGRTGWSASRKLSVAGAAVCVVLVAYLFGSRGGGRGEEQTTLAGRTGRGDESTHLSVLTDGNGAAKADKAPPKGVSDPELAKLLDKPPAKKPAVRAVEPSVMTNRPAVNVNGQSAAAVNASELNYLQIETFRITRDRDGEQIAKDVEDARRFLMERGIKTFVQKRSNGSILFAEEGFSPGREVEGQRSAFAAKLEQLGQEYRKQGGLYQFKGCFFVSHAHAKGG